MEIIYSTEISIPLAQIIAFLLISTVTFLFGKIKRALLGNYLFSRHWAYIFKRDFSRNDPCLFIDLQFSPQYSRGANKANPLQVDHDKRQ
jgi:hypothetical protein